MAFGMGTHMGCEVSWTFIFRPDGAFYEEVHTSPAMVNKACMNRLQGRSYQQITTSAKATASPTVLLAGVVP
jgi:hypothetical protein